MPLNTLTMGSYLYELFTYGLISPNSSGVKWLSGTFRRLEYPGGTGSDPVKKKKKENIFFRFFLIHCIGFIFSFCCICT